MEQAVKMLQKFSEKSKKILQEDINLFGRVYIYLSQVCYSDTLVLQHKSVIFLLHSLDKRPLTALEYGAIFHLGLETAS